MVGSRGVPLARCPTYLLRTPAQIAFVPGYGQAHPLRGAVIGSMMGVLGMDLCAIGVRGGAIGGECGVLCRWWTACHRLRGGDVYVRARAPRMSPTPRSAKYGVTHGCHLLPGWRKCPPLPLACGDAEVGRALFASMGPIGCSIFLA